MPKDKQLFSLEKSQGMFCLLSKHKIGFPFCWPCKSLRKTPWDAKMLSNLIYRLLVPVHLSGEPKMGQRSRGRLLDFAYAVTVRGAASVDR